MIVYGHRGAAGEAPENTLAGFAHAMAYGIRHFELDLRVAKDGEIVVIHDTTLARTHGSRASVVRRSVPELSALQATGQAYEWSRSTGVPSLHAVVRQCRGVEHLQFEVKTGQLGDEQAFCERLAKFVREARLVPQVTVTSLDSALLARMQVVAPDISRGLVCEVAPPDPVALALDLGCDTLALSHELTDARRVQRAREAGLKISCWTVNALPVATRLYQLGVDSIISDYPAALLAHVAMLQKLRSTAVRKK